MKLLLILDADRHVVDWDKDLSEFPNMAKYNGSYYQWVMWDDDESGLVHKKLLFSKMSEEALPVDLYGNLLPVSDLNWMFQLKDKSLEPCSCGARFTSFPNHHMTICPKWSR